MTLLSTSNNNNKKWPENQRRLRALARLLAFCRYRLDSTSLSDEPEEEDLVVFSWIRSAVEGRWMLNLLPLLFEYFLVIGPEGVRKR